VKQHHFRGRSRIMSSFIAWQDYYSVGDDFIDSQHKQIIDIINQLYLAQNRGADHSVVLPLLDKLVQYTINHFRDEENLLLKNHFPDFMPHKAIHDKMRKETMAWRENANAVTEKDLLRFLKNWWVNHIQIEDKKYAPYLQTKVGV
jgi:hemerythrin-like metal-binding protein